MKKLLTLSIIAILAACSTSSQQDDTDRIGTWRIDSPEHATWMGGDEVAQNYYIMQSDSTDPDSTITMVYPNSDFSVEMTEEVFYPNTANISLTITDAQIPPSTNIGISIDTTNAQLGNNFIKFYGNAASKIEEGYKVSPTYLFDCNTPINLSEGTLTYILTGEIPNSDSTFVFKYNLRLKGVQQAAFEVVCN